MISIDTIEQEILELENRDASWTNVEHLAWLYIVHDHLKTSHIETTGEIEGGEFCKACSNVPMDRLLKIIAEHMEGIKIIYPREYTAIMDKIGEL